MKKLADILSYPYTDEEYLTKKHRDLEKDCTAACDEVRELSKNPVFTKRTVASAEQYMQNLFVLPGTGGKPFFVGDPPRWNDRPVPDVEYVYSLNRLYELMPLCQAYLITGDDKYSKKAIADMQSWVKECPRPALSEDRGELLRTFNGLSPWRILECGIRMFESWNDLYNYLLLSDAMTPEAHSDYVISACEQAEVISKVSPIAWPDAAHNHYIHEMLGLLIVAIRFPELKMASEWREQATRELLRSIKAQIMPDGAHLEGCANYHDICLDMIAQAMIIFSKNGIEVPSDVAELIDRAYEHSVWTVSSTGNLASVGDSYMQPRFIPRLIDGYYARKGNVGPYTAILPLIDRSHCVGTPDAPFEEAKSIAKTLPGGIRHYESIGQIIARTGWTRDDAYFHFVCRTPVFNGHSQQDPMSFSLVMGGENVVIDPSYLTYNNSDDRRRYKSIKYHSSLTFGDKEPFEYLSAWDYGPQKKGHTVKAYQDGDMLAGDAFHENYAPCGHRRLCALLGNDTFIVCDDVYNPTHEDVKLRFHLSTREYKLTQFGATDNKISIFLPNGRHELTDATKSPFTDLEEPSSILSAEPSSQGEHEIYLTLFTTRTNVPTLKAHRDGDEINISISRNARTEQIVWKFGESCRKIS